MLAQVNLDTAHCTPTKCNYTGVRRSRVVTFAAIRLLGPWFKPRPGQKFETRFLLHSHPSGGEGVPPVQGEIIRRRYMRL